MEPWHCTRAEIAELIFATWPDFGNQEISWIDSGWDFHIAVLANDLVVRIARTHASQWRLHREVAVLSHLSEAPVALPRYERVAPGMAVYRFIPGQPWSTKGMLGMPIREQVAQFIGWLHGNHGLVPSVDGRTRWRRRLRALCRRVEYEALPLFSVKEARCITARFQEMAERLQSDGWGLALLHADLTADHVLIEGDRVRGIIDFGDWQWGDEAYDWAGLAGMEAVLPMRLANDPDFRHRLRFYQFAQGFHGIQHALKMGRVEAAEQYVRIVRRQILE